MPGIVNLRLFFHEDMLLCLEATILSTLGKTGAGEVKWTEGRVLTRAVQSQRAGTGSPTRTNFSGDWLSGKSPRPLASTGIPELPGAG